MLFVDGGGTRDEPNGAIVLKGACELLHPARPTTVMRQATNHFIGRFLSARRTLDKTANRRGATLTFGVAASKIIFVRKSSWHPGQARCRREMLATSE